MTSRNTEDNWHAMYMSIVNYKKRNDHCFVPLSYGTLGRWCDDQRMAYRLYQNGNPSKFSRAKIELLDSVGFSWVHESKRDQRWHELYGKLLEFKEGHGHCNVPKKYRDNMSLGSWVDYQRILYRQTKKIGLERNPNAISAERIRLLSALNFRWGTYKEKKPELATLTAGGKKNDLTQVNIMPEPVSANGRSDNNRNFANTSSPSNRTVMVSTVGPNVPMPFNARNFLDSRVQANPNYDPNRSSFPESQSRCPRATIPLPNEREDLETKRSAPNVSFITQPHQQYQAKSDVPQQEHPHKVRVIHHLPDPPPPPSPYNAYLPLPPDVHYYLNTIPPPAAGETIIYVHTAAGQAGPPPEVTQHLSGVYHPNQCQQAVVHRTSYY